MSNLRTGTIVLILLATVAALVGWYGWSSMNADGHHASSGTHSQDDLEPVDVDGPYPTLSVSLKQRPDGDRVLHLSTENYSFRSPIDTGPARGLTGHGPLLVDGESIAMFYKARYVLPDFMPGEYRLRITLNEHESHRPIRAGHEIVSDTLLLTVPDRADETR